MYIGFFEYMGESSFDFPCIDMNLTSPFRAVCSPLFNCRYTNNCPFIFMRSPSCYALLSELKVALNWIGTISPFRGALVSTPLHPTPELQPLRENQFRGILLAKQLYRRLSTLASNDGVHKVLFGIKLKLSSESFLYSFPLPFQSLSSDIPRLLSPSSQCSLGLR
jgi:hypothetical protein